MNFEKKERKKKSSFDRLLFNVVIFEYLKKDCVWFWSFGTKIYLFANQIFQYGFDSRPKMKIKIGQNTGREKKGTRSSGAKNIP